MNPTPRPSRCRLCRHPLPHEPFFQLAPMPAAAQNLPTFDQLAADRPATLTLSCCPRCTLVQSRDPPPPYWRDVIRAVAYSDAMRHLRRQQFADFVRRYHLNGKTALEIGSGRGEYLQLLAEAGLRPTGCEHHRDNVRHARAAGHRVVTAFPHPRSRLWPGAPFAALCSFNFIEHWPDPVAVLTAAARQLAPDAVALIEAPNFEMILAKGLLAEFIADHLSYFTRATLSLTLQLAGFEPLAIRTLFDDYILSIEARRLSLPTPAPFRTTLTTLTRTLRELVDRYAPRPIALWGAGHQAIAAIALAGIGLHIAYVVDSAPFKQGRYTPVTHRPIVPPHHLRDHPPAALLVAAGGYNWEIARQARALCPELPIFLLDGDRLAPFTDDARPSS
ncbi:MAG: class I SAM-dependent methyltransferase [Hydrogenophilus sp.]|nr:class I SAM-dependent methyltransferase [Hydrogenophilus sp.]